MRVTISTDEATIDIRDDVVFSPDVLDTMCRTAGDLLARTLVTLNAIDGPDDDG